MKGGVGSLLVESFQVGSLPILEKRLPAGPIWQYDVGNTQNGFFLRGEYHPLSWNGVLGLETLSRTGPADYILILGQKKTYKFHIISLIQVST